MVQLGGQRAMDKGAREPAVGPGALASV